MSERKPVLEWDGDDKRLATSVCIYWIYKMDRSSQWYAGFRKSRIHREDFTNDRVGTYPTADAAKLACEDHLLTLLEPLAKTIEKLKENREK